MRAGFWECRSPGWQKPQLERQGRGELRDYFVKDRGRDGRVKSESRFCEDRAPPCRGGAGRGREKGGEIRGKLEFKAGLRSLNNRRKESIFRREPSLKRTAI